jgi:hypothetical protein
MIQYGSFDSSLISSSCSSHLTLRQVLQILLSSPHRAQKCHAQWASPNHAYGRGKRRTHATIIQNSNLPLLSSCVWSATTLAGDGHTFVWLLLSSFGMTGRAIPHEATQSTVSSLLLLSYYTNYKLSLNSQYAS